jgi:high affinity sulfate transporter 1
LAHDLTVSAIWRLRPPHPKIPGVVAFRAWRRTGRQDTVAGVAVAAYLIPQCLAYARLAGLAPVAGLWAALAALVVYALAGTSRLLSVGPESASALLVGSAVASLTKSRGITPAQAAAALAIAVGVLAFVAWVARLGFLADLLSRPVLVGYLAGVAVTMIVSQLPNLTGITVEHRNTVERAVDVARGIGAVTPAPLLLGAAVVVSLFALQRWRGVPGPLLVMLVATAVTAAFDLESHGIDTVGTVPRGLPTLSFPTIPADRWPAVFVAALGIAVVAYSGNILTGRAFAHRREERIDPNQELFALGAANAAAGLVGGFPVSSSESRTALADATRAASQLASLAAAAVVALALVAATSLLEAFPLAALAGLVVYAATKLIDTHEIRRVFAFRYSEAVLMTAAFIGVIAFDLLIGIGIAVALSAADLFRRVARAHDAVQGSVPGLAGLHDVDDYPHATTLPGLVVYRYDAPLFFANAEDFRTRVLDAVAQETTPVEWVVLNMEANVEIDITATDMLDELRNELASRHITLALARVKQDLAVYLARAGLIQTIGTDHVFPTLPTAVEGFQARTRPRPADGEPPAT